MSLADAVAWFYLNEFDKIVGPFPESVMQNWFWTSHYFTRGSKVCRIEFRREEGWVVENAYTFELEVNPEKKPKKHQFMGLLQWFATPKRAFAESSLEDPKTHGRAPTGEHVCMNARNSFVQSRFAFTWSVAEQRRQERNESRALEQARLAKEKATRVNRARNFLYGNNKNAHKKGMELMRQVHAGGR